MTSGVRISNLNQREIDASDTLVRLARKLSLLSAAQLDKVFERWDMLHMIEGEEHQFFRKWLKRVNEER